MLEVKRGWRMIEARKPMARPLHDCTVLIAGGTAGVGLASAAKFAASGVRRLAIVGRDAVRGQRARGALLADAPDAEVLFVSADVNRPEEATGVAREVHGRLGRIDVLLNSTVGPFGPKLLHKIQIEDIEPTVRLQLMGPLIMSRAVLPYMREDGGGVILNVSSDAGKLATPGETVIGAAMAGIIMFSRSLALEGKRDGIRVNALTPSLIEGTLTHERVMADEFSSKLFTKAREAAALGVVRPEDMAELIVFLASPQAAKITGQTISMNGGISAA
jgi:2-hydroxycyclohexanecarboxyl-CoA dehydrogenase